MSRNGSLVRKNNFTDSTFKVFKFSVRCIDVASGATLGGEIHEAQLALERLLQQVRGLDMPRQVRSVRECQGTKFAAKRCQLFVDAADVPGEAGLGLAHESHVADGALELPD